MKDIRSILQVVYNIASVFIIGVIVGNSMNKPAPPPPPEMRYKESKMGFK